MIAPINVILFCMPLKQGQLSRNLMHSIPTHLAIYEKFRQHHFGDRQPTFLSIICHTRCRSVIGDHHTETGDRAEKR